MSDRGPDVKPLSECSLLDLLDELDASIVQANHEFERYCDNDDCITLWGAYTAINNILGVLSPRPSPRASPRPVNGSALSSPRGAEGSATAASSYSPRPSDKERYSVFPEDSNGGGGAHEKENRKGLFAAYELIDGPVVLKGKPLHDNSESLTYLEYLRALVRMRRRASGETLLAESKTVSIDALMAGIARPDNSSSSGGNRGDKDKDKNRFKEQGVKDAVRRATIRRFEADKDIQTGLLAFPAEPLGTEPPVIVPAVNSPRADPSSSAKAALLLASTRPTFRSAPLLARTSADDTSLLTLNTLSLSQHTSRQLSEILQRDKLPFPSGPADRVLPIDWFRHLQLYEDLQIVLSTLLFWSAERKNKSNKQRPPAEGIDKRRVAKRAIAVLYDFDINSMYGSSGVVTDDLMICTDDLHPLFQELLSAKVIARGSTAPFHVPGEAYLHDQLTFFRGDTPLYERDVKFVHLSELLLFVEYSLLPKVQVELKALRSLVAAEIYTNARTKAAKGAKREIARRQVELENSEAWQQLKRIEEDKSRKKLQVDLYGLPDGAELLSREQRRHARAMDAQKALESRAQIKSPRSATSSTAQQPTSRLAVEEKGRDGGEEDQDEETKREATAVPLSPRRDAVIISPRRPPVKTDDAPSKGMEAPVKTDDAPSKGKEAPVKTDDTPSKGKEASLKTDDAPSKGKEASLKTDDAQSKGKEASLKTDDAPSKGKEASLKTDDAPSKGMEAPVKTDDAPSKGKEASLKTDDAPSKGKEAPVKTDDAPSKGKEAPVKTDDAPSKGMEAPVKTDALSDNRLSVRPVSAEAESGLKKSASQASDVSGISSNSDDGINQMTPSSSRDSLIERRGSPKRFRLDTGFKEEKLENGED